MKKLERNQKRPFTTKERSRQSKPLPPDPELLNVIRARRAAVALAELQRQTGADLEDAVSDLLADLMHWCDRFDQSFAEELHRARYHYEEETKASPETTAPRSDEL